MPWVVITPRTKDMAVHAILLPRGESGQILYFGGYVVDDTHLFDIQEESIADIPAENRPDYNIFCAGHAFTTDGNVLVAGGNLPPVIDGQQPPVRPALDENGDPILDENGNPVLRATLFDLQDVRSRSRGSLG